MLSEKQLQMRRTGIGASECAVAADCHPFLNVFDLYNAKVYGVITDENDAMRAGSFLENGIGRMYTSETGIKLHKAPTRRHPKHKWMLATVDRYAVNDNRKRKHLVEIKCPGSRYYYNRETGEREQVWGHDSSAVPDYIACQAQWQMEVTGFDRCDIAVLFLDSREFAIFPQHRNQRMIDALVKINHRFWHRHIVAQVPPRLDASAAAREYLRQKYPLMKKGLLPAPAEAEEWARRYVKALADINRAKHEKDLAGNELRELIGEFEGYSDSWGHTTWKLERNGYDYKAMAEHLLEGVDPKMAERIKERFRRRDKRVLRVHVKEGWHVESDEASA